MTAGELSRALAAQAERIARELLPNGKQQQGEWVVGNVQGDPGKSTSICIRGEKAGVWEDFATGEHGDLLDLIRATSGKDMKQACDQARAMLGLTDSMPLQSPKREYKTPPKPKCQTPKSAVKEYLNGRGISDATIAAYRVGENGSKMIFPFLRDGNLVLAKAREAADGAAPKPTSADCEPILFGWQVIGNDARSVLITEGEIDAMSVYEMGFPALSLPFGGGGGNKQQWIENEFDRLGVMDEVFLWLDNDSVGQQAVDEIVKRLGPERIRIVTTEYKDANEYLTKAKPTAQQVANLILSAKHLDPSELRSAADYFDQVMNEVESSDLPGIDMPWNKAHNLFKMRFGESIVLAGVNGHGKTLMAGNLVLAALSQGERTCVASYEFLPHRWLRRTIRQTVGVENPTRDAAESAFRWYTDKLWIVNAKGKERAERTLEVFRYAARRYACRFFVIDNLSKCGIADDDYQAQKEFIDQISELARELDVIVLVVMHMTKGDESQPGGKMQARGSGQITDLVDSFLVVWRNKPKEAAQRNGDHSKDEEPDAKLICEKQRNGEEEPRFALWLHKPSEQYLEHPKAFARKYGSAA